MELPIKVILILTMLLLSSAVFSFDLNGFKRELRESFEPFPHWWSDYRTVNLEVSSYSDILTFWQSEKRCCSKEIVEKNNKQFIRTIYPIILKTNDIHTIAFGAKLLNISYHDHPNMAVIQEVLFRHFSNYQMPLDHCANCQSGDLAADSLSKYMSQLRKSNKREEASKTALIFLNERKDISPYKAARLWRMVVFYKKELGNLQEAKALLKLIIPQFQKKESNPALKSEIKQLISLKEKLNNYSIKKKNSLKFKVSTNLEKKVSYNLHGEGFNVDKLKAELRSTIKYIMKIFVIILLFSLIIFGYFFFRQKTSYDKADKEEFFKD